MAIVFTGLGGFLGSCARYLLSKALAAAAPHFPCGTLLSNLIAGLLIGFIIGVERQSAALPAG